MQSARFAVLLVVLVPFLGQTQDLSARSDSSPAAPPLVSASPDGGPERPGRARLLSEEEEEDLSQPTRIGVGSLMGLLGGVAGGCLGYGGAYLLAPKSNKPLYTSLVLVGGTLGMSTAVYGFGSLMGARGRFLPTLLGGAVGAVLPALGLITGLPRTSNANRLTLLGFVAMLGLAGPIVGYELSHAAALAPGAPAPRASTGPRVYPVVAATSEGGALGLAGQF